MRLTWFGGSAFRIYVGGRIIVTDPHAAPAGIDRGELVAGADHVIAFDHVVAGIAPIETEKFVPRRRRRPIDELGRPDVRLFALPRRGLLVDDPDGVPLILVSTERRRWDRPARGATIVVFGPASGVPYALSRLVAATSPKLVAVAAERLDEPGLAEIIGVMDACPLQVLEPGLSIEA